MLSVFTHCVAGGTVPPPDGGAIEPDAVLFVGVFGPMRRNSCGPTVGAPGNAVPSTRAATIVPGLKSLSCVPVKSGAGPVRGVSGVPRTLAFKSDASWARFLATTILYGAYAAGPMVDPADAEPATGGI